MSNTPGADGRVALVTGGGRGVGRAISMEMARAGIDVAINWRRDETAAEATMAAVEALGRTCRLYRASIDVWEDDEAMVDAVLSDFGRVDILINNAGIASRGLSVADTDPLEVSRVVATHAFGPFYLSKLLVPQMRTRGGGHVVFISSVATSQNSANGSPYNMGKAALESLALTLAKEEQGHGTRVNIVAPGLVATDMGDRLARAMTGGEVQGSTELDASFPFDRVCRPDDVASVVGFLVSEAASYVSGQRIAVDGGGAPTSFRSPSR